MVALLWILLICSILLNLGLLAELTWVNRDFGKAMENSAFFERLARHLGGQLGRNECIYKPPHTEVE